MNFYNCPRRIIVITVITVITVIITIITIIIIKSFDSTRKGFYDKLSLDNINIITCIKVIISCRLDKYLPAKETKIFSEALTNTAKNVDKSALLPLTQK